MRCDDEEYADTNDAGDIGVLYRMGTGAGWRNAHHI